LRAYSGCVVNDNKTICHAFEGHCAQPDVCPLSQIKAGTIVCIKQLDAAPDVTHRLRELGLREEQRIRLVSRQSTYICQVCNARLGISEQLAENILVQTVPAAQPAA
jgi:Fe2+ transport system protein FeoA